MRSEHHLRHAAIALCSAATILLQITVTRVLSIVLWYHWAFFSISLAMLGVGASKASLRSLLMDKMTELITEYSGGMTPV